MSEQTKVMDKIVALCRRRGFIFGSSEIYGGIGGFWDYGPLGTELKRNIKNVWWHDMVTNPPTGPDGKDLSMVGLDCSIIMNPKVWEASGHVGGFSDPMVDCTACKKRFRSDEVINVELTHCDDELPDSLDEKTFLTLYHAEPDYYLLTDQRDLSVPVDRFLKKTLRAKISEYKYPKNPVSQLGNLVFVKSSKGSFYVKGWFDHLQVDWSDLSKLHCPFCDEKGSLTEPRSFNLMFQTYVGALQDASSVSYLRPETAQGIFVNYKNVMDSTRVKIPFGIAQIGKAFRNEINPRNFTFRSREFEQMEIEFFCHENDSRMWYEFWRDLRLKWYENLGIKSEKLRPREQEDDELAHYSNACTDVEYLFPFSDEPQELEGIAHRGDFDLKAHGMASKRNEDAFAVIDEQTKERFVPHVVEPSAGVDRFALAAICEAYHADESRPSPEFLKFHPRLAPIKAAVFPLVAKEGMPEVAEGIYRDIKRHYRSQLDVKQSIGKRYARMDEAGTPYCFTVDGETLKDGTVTVRDRDTCEQERIDKSRCADYLRDKLHI